MKKLICAILSAALLLMLFSGCAPAPAPSEAPTPSPSVSPTTSIGGFNAELFTPDTVMFKADGKDVLWSEYLYWLAADINYIYSLSGQYPTDWDSALSDKMTMKDYVLNSTTNSIAMYRAVEKKAAELGILMTEQDKKDVDEMINGFITSSGSKEAFLESLSKSYLSEELYRYLMGTATLYEKIFTNMYGDNAAGFSDKDTMAFASEKGYMRVKHIFVASDSDAAKDAEAKAKLQTLLEQIKAGGESGREALFDELMNANSQDTGLKNYPDGYLFKSGDMDTQFESAAQALSENSVSEVIKSGHGYHIILRLPISPEDRVFDVTGTAKYTLRYFAAYSEYQKIVDGWTREVVIENSDSLKNIDMTKIYK